MKKLVLNQVTLCADGSIGLQWLKQVLDPDTGEVLFSEPHRSIVPIDGDVDAQVAHVSAHFQRMGYGQVDADELARIKAVDAVGRADQNIESMRREKIEAQQEQSK